MLSKVAVGVLLNDQQQILISKRSENVQLGGLWEFPGGKLNPSETGWQALVREFQEEVGLSIQSGEQLLKIDYYYEKQLINLDVWWIYKYRGHAQGCEGQAIAWVYAHELKHYEFPPANRVIIDTINKRLEGRHNDNETAKAINWNGRRIISG